MRIAAVALLLCFPAASVGAQWIEVEPNRDKAFNPFEPGEIAERYPEEKAWQSLAVLQVRGSGRSVNWGLEGEVHFHRINRYQTRVKVEEHEAVGSLVTLVFKVDVLDASSSNIYTRRRMRLADFESTDPVFSYALTEGMGYLELLSPSLRLVRAVIAKGEQIDPRYERTLSEIARRLGISDVELIAAKGAAGELEWVEEPRVYSGCSFLLRWEHDEQAKLSAVTQVKEVESASGDSPRLSEEDIRFWAYQAEPLVGLYVFPSLAKRVGDEWALDASRATSVFVGRSDAASTGKINLRYESNGRYNDSSVRNVSVLNGNVGVILRDDEQETRYQINGMEGEFKVGDEDGLLLMSHGTGRLNYHRLSTNHFLFKAEVTRDFEGHWRYEATRRDSP